MRNKKGIVRETKVDKLFRAAETGDIDSCTRLIEREGLNVNSREGGRYCTPLMKACANSQFYVVKFLLEKNANIEAVDNIGWNALTWVCWGAGQGAGWIVERTLPIIRELIQKQQRLM